jgi:hypothetical protein
MMTERGRSWCSGGASYTAVGRFEFIMIGGRAGEFGGVPILGFMAEGIDWGSPSSSSEKEKDRGSREGGERGREKGSNWDAEMARLGALRVSSTNKGVSIVNWLVWFA